MTAKEFIDKYLTVTSDLVVELHSPTNMAAQTFSIAEYNTGNTDEPLEEGWLDCEVSQIYANVQTYGSGLNVVIHIYTDCGYEEVGE